MGYISNTHDLDNVDTSNNIIYEYTFYIPHINPNSN